MDKSPKPPRSHTIIYLSDLKHMVGRRSIHQAYRLLREIKQHYGKPPRSYVTVEEFCEYTKSRRYEIQHIIDCIRRDEELAYYSTVDNPPRNVLAKVDMREDDMFLWWN